MRAAARRFPLAVRRREDLAVPRLEIDVPGIDLTSVLGPVAMVRRDPTVRLRPGRLDRATLTPDGPVALSVTWRGGGDRSAEASVEAWGEGADWALDRADRLLGLADDVDAFDPRDELVRELWRRRPGLRLTRTGTLWHDLAWLIVQQRVTTVDASLQWRRLVSALGEPAPGPLELRLPPTATAVAARPYHVFHRLGIERARADRLRIAAAEVGRAEQLVDGPYDAARPRLEAIPGVGPWTTGFLAAHTWGDPDAVIVGDHGLPGVVGWVLDGAAGADDARMLELLEPHRPQRYRVLRLLLGAGSRPPRRHHRARRVDIRGR